MGLAVGCESHDLACASDPHDWYDNPTYTMFHAYDGAFDFDPVGDAVARRKGTYNYDNGDFYWIDDHADGHWIATLAVTGYGTIYDDADLDLIARHTTTDVLGAVQATRVRTRRSGCDGTFTVTEFDPALDVEADPPTGARSYDWTVRIVSDDKVHERMEGTVETSVGEMSCTVDRTLTSDVAEYRTVKIGEQAYWLDQTWRYDGTGVGWWIALGPPLGLDADYVGEDEYFFDGSTLSTFDRLKVGTQNVEAQVSLLWSYDGSATGTCTWWDEGTEVVCSVVIDTDGTCEMDCGAYGTYDC